MKLRLKLAAALLAALPVICLGAEGQAAPTSALSDLVARVHKKTGKQFIMEPQVADVRISMAGLDTSRVDYPMLRAILRYYSLVAFEEKEVVTILAERDARQLPMRTITADDPKIADEELVTRVVQVNNICVAHTVPILRPLMPQFAHLAAYPGIQTLIITDRADNVRRIADLVERLDKAATGKQDCGGERSGS